MNYLKTLFFVSSIFVSASAWAEGGGDRVMERMESMRNKAETVLIQAEKAPAGQRHVHMAEHMKMLGEIMKELHNDHPDASMTTQQHLAWMEKHDKIVDDVLIQMQREHKLMLSENHQ
ncbi:co-regulatory protein PtrA N-terminal domain-containing protein [Pseudomonas sp. Ant30-3]|uniref:co-regulatory protein PtrA N-terminal domain-containing protein n=1 Tax=Pseudomonas sp. Ant30-3 TaxID=1488328 RepID=UPI00048A7F0F|nr:co-regulatory protein PtrA N-terminal domain-containing protein [Pseudomonas sp. Ant30-3]